MNNGWSVVTSVSSCAVWIRQNRCPQYIIGKTIGLTHALINHIRQTHLCIPLNLHPHLYKYSNNASVLTNGPMTHRTHARVN